MRDRRYLAFIPLAALIAISPLLFSGSSCGHDFEFHLRNWLEVGSQWKQGALLPRWAFTVAWNAGEPRFVFYPPLSWSIGALLALVLPWAAVPATLIWLALTCCGFTMHRLACQWTSPDNALIAAAFYIVHPYMLFTFYERAAYAELLAAAWIPLVFLSILRARLTIAGIAIPLSLLWLTNAPAAVMGSYAFAILAVIRVVYSYRNTRSSDSVMREIATIVSGAALGLGVAAFYIVPATIEQHWVKISMPYIPGVRYQDNFFFQRIGDPSHDAILRTASLCGLALIALAAIAFVVARLLRGTKMRSGTDNCAHAQAVMALGIVTCIISFLLTAPSAVLWRHVPELLFLQFPWRFCAILGATVAALLALALRPARLHAAAATTIAFSLTFVLTLCGNHFFRQYCFSSFSASGIADSFYNGGRYDLTDEYPPVGADGSALQHANPSFWIAANPSDPAPAHADADYSVSLGNRLHFNVATPVPAFIVINLRDYRAWKIAVNGGPIGVRPHRNDGLIAVPIACGISQIDISYAHTGDMTAGWIVTALSIVALLFVRRRQEGAASL